MPGVIDLDELLRSMRPTLVESEFVFCTVSGSLEEYGELGPVATFIESVRIPAKLNTDSGGT